MTEILKKYLDYKSIRNEMLTGSIKSEDRVTSI